MSTSATGTGQPSCYAAPESLFRRYGLDVAVVHLHRFAISGVPDVRSYVEGLAVDLA